MINVRPEGRLGNNIFQYVFARIVHEETGLALNYSVGTKFLKTPKIEGVQGVGEHIVIQDNRGPVVLNDVVSACRGKNVLIHGFFQEKIYYQNRRQNIKQWLGEIPNSNPKTTGVHIRKGDYKSSKYWDLPDSYFLKAIEESNPTRLIVFTDEPNYPLVERLVAMGAILSKSNDAESDMFLLGTCSDIIMSRSTFSWWSGFLSCASRIYAPRTNVGFWSGCDSVLEIDSNEYRYLNVEL